MLTTNMHKNQDLQIISNYFCLQSLQKIPCPSSVCSSEHKEYRDPCHHHCQQHLRSIGNHHRARIKHVPKYSKTSPSRSFKGYPGNLNPWSIKLLPRTKLLCTSIAAVDLGIKICWTVHRTAGHKTRPTDRSDHKTLNAEVQCQSR